jgi:phospholipid/cholesterol/gamma-HCH transport system ATP-binding protein
MTETASPTPAQDTPALIRIRDLKKSFGQQQILKGLHLDIPKGSVCVILGGSGMGKSVLLKHLAGLLKPDSGEVWVAGEDLVPMRGKALQKYRRKIGKVFQEGALFDSMTIFENVAFPLREHTKLRGEALKEKVEHKLRLFSLNPDEVNEKYPAELSGGMRKRVALARAVALDPSILLYDEPTTGLDPITTDQVDQLILHAKAELGVTSIVISHDISSAFHIADQLLFIFKGEIVVRGKREDILQCEHPYVHQFVEKWRQKNQ